VHFSRPQAVSECFSANLHPKSIQEHITAAVGHALTTYWQTGNRGDPILKSRREQTKAKLRSNLNI
jgi:hypothetical protein